MQEYEGVLRIDPDEGIAIFTTNATFGLKSRELKPSIRILRITHLPDPIPPNYSIDIVALPALTSYTPIESEWREAPQGTNKTSDNQLETRHNNG